MTETTRPPEPRHPATAPPAAVTPHATALVGQPDNPKLAMWVFLGGEVVFFTTLILSFVLVRLRNPAGYAGFKGHLSVPLIGANTFVLILSSYFVVRALEAIRGGSQAGLRTNLIVVIVLGLLFLGGQGYEWVTLFGDGESVHTLFGTPFFTVTGLHGAHVAVGVVWGMFVLISALRGAYSARQSRGVEFFGLYWHFVDIVWIVLFTLFYLI
jgi:heme/copper-type cytochrome/quinol oxidase subunit 3